MIGDAPSMAFEPRQIPSSGVPALWLRTLGGRVEAWLETERDNIALWTPVGLGAGISAWFCLPNGTAWAAWICAALGLIAASFLLPQGMRLGRMMLFAGILGAAGCALAWGKAVWVAEPALERPLFTQFSAEVEEVRALPARDMVRAYLKPVGRPDLPPRLRVNIGTRDVPEGLAAGSVIALRGRLMPPAGPTLPGGYDFARRAWFEGVGATGRAVGPVVMPTPAPDGTEGPLRQRLSAHIQTRLEGGEGSIAAALATGDQGSVPEADMEAMRQSGLAHLLSISGLHVTALVGGVVFLIFRLMALSPTLALRWPLMLIAASAGAAAGVGYTLFTGAEVPTVRSCIAALLVLGGLALGREAITLRLVATGAIIVMLFWPEALIGPSFQLSFAAVTAIVALHEHPPFRKMVERREEDGLVRRWMRSLFALFLTGIAVEMVLSPIALFHFHKTGVWGAFANILAIPLTTFVIMPLEALALLLDAAGLGAPVWWLTGLALSLLLALAHWVSALPGSVALLPVFPGWTFGLVVAGGLWIALWRSRVRWWGVLPAALGIVAMLTTPAPDLLVTGDGRHVAVRHGDGLAILRGRAGDYVRDTLSESAGYEGALKEIAALPSARCSLDACALDMVSGGRNWRILMTRSSYLLPWGAFTRQCRDADIVISDRRLPAGCTPRWLKLDRPFLRRNGGVSIHLARQSVRTAIRPGDAHPWIVGN